MFIVAHYVMVAMILSQSNLGDNVAMHRLLVLLVLVWSCPGQRVNLYCVGIIIDYILEYRSVQKRTCIYEIARSMYEKVLEILPHLSSLYGFINTDQVADDCFLKRSMVSLNDW